jgi:hypothetical protein
MLIGKIWTKGNDKLLKGFNQSIWHSAEVLLPIACVVFLSAFLSLKKGSWYFFDPQHNTDPKLKDGGDFGPHSSRYQDLAKLAITLSAGAVAFLITILATDKCPLPTFVQKVEAVAPIVAGYFGLTIALLLGFMIAQTVCYEQYCHSPNHDTYNRWKYALNMSLGWTGFISFVLGFGWLACNLFD